MKNLKKLALGLLVAVLAVGFSAFKDTAKNTKLTTIYYGFNDDTGNYELINGQPDPNKCIEGNEQCVVVADTEDELNETLSPSEVTMLGLQPWEESEPDSQYDF